MNGCIKAAELGRRLGISRRTISDWCRSDEELAFKKDGDYYIRLSALAKRDGLDDIKVRTILNSRLIKAVQLSELAGIPRRTLSRWCKQRPNLAIRIGRIYYLSVDSLGCTDEQAEMLKNNRLADVIALLKSEEV